jgi:hypothetical protein
MTQQPPLQIFPRDDGTYPFPVVAHAELQVEFDPGTDSVHNLLILQLLDGKQLELPLTPAARSALELSLGAGSAPQSPRFQGGR